ncbi:MAG: DNA mismatch repair endonuclease MutL [Firmicutes bacterium]|nr:DNA mismatch repair endonuclease MutL [Bacillota bacterium]
MASIRLLDENTANKIAAGEVIERPAAVVKELIENAVDAGATRIDIQIAGGGLELIRVADNGCGMAAEDVPLALQRHATSKITLAEDLARIQTLGFRGEALPSIAAVSRFSLATRRAEDTLGTEIIVHGGKTVSLEAAGCPAGTTVKVEDLFYNTPARLKFMKSAAAETARIRVAVERLALAWPGISFTLAVNGRTVFTTPGSGNPGDAVLQVLGRQNMRQLLPFSYTGTLLRLSGFLAKPTLSRANRTLQYFFVNRRPVFSPLLADALQTAYQTLLPRSRFPAAVIYLDTDLGEVDVNVHPTKKEVRFSRERDVYRQFLIGVKTALQENSLLGEFRPDWSQNRHRSAFNLTLKDYGITAAQTAQQPVITRPAGLQAAARQATAGPPGLQGSRAQELSPPVEETTASEETGASVALARTTFPELHPLGQYRRTYILAQSTGGDLYLVDQHAAHERILYDMLKKDVSSGTLSVQEIIPQTFELDPASAAALEESLATFASLGLNIARFGNNSFVLRSVPVFWKDLLRQEELIDLLTETHAGGHKLQLFERSLQMMACKGAIKANRQLERSEMSALLQNLAVTAEPYTCPHGRPTVMIIPAQTVDRNFRRG